MKYMLEIDSTQASVLINALDLYSRIHIGQFTEILKPFRFSKKVEIKDVRAAEHMLDAVKFLLTGFEYGVSYGIHSEEVSDDARVAYDLQQVIRNVQSHTERPLKKGDWRGVNYDTPFTSSTTHPELAKMEPAGE